MADLVTYKMVGDWRNTMTSTMNNALRVSMDFFDREVQDACKRALTVMAKHAGESETKIAPSRRQVYVDEGGEYVNTYRQGDPNPKPVHKWRFEPERSQLVRLDGTWEDAKKIKNRGVGQRSWMWQLGGARAGIPGATKLLVVKRKGKSVGLILENKLHYILKIMAPDWQKRCEKAAINKIMGHVADKLCIHFGTALTMGGGKT